MNSIFHYYLGLQRINLFFLYIECDYLVLFSSLGIVKVKHSLLNNCFVKNIFFFINEKNSLLEFFFNEIFLLVNYGYIQKYRLRGLGYRQLNYNGDLMQIKLRYSHVLFRYFPFSLLTYSKYKYRKFVSIYGLNKPLINKYIYLWISFRIANTYTKKGFFKRNRIVFFKEKAKRSR